MGHVAETADWMQAGRQVRNAEPGRREPTVLMLLDGGPQSTGLTKVCEFLGIDVEPYNPDHSLAEVLKSRRPLAVCTELEGQRQDGCHVMKIVGEYDATLPVLLLTGFDPVLAGAADAVEDIWNLTGVARWNEMPPVGEVVEFLSNAGRKGRCLSFMPG
jgi:hypothetical protein